MSSLEVSELIRRVLIINLNKYLFTYIIDSNHFTVLKDFFCQLDYKNTQNLNTNLLTLPIIIKLKYICINLLQFSNEN